MEDRESWQLMWTVVAMAEDRGTWTQTATRCWAVADECNPSLVWCLFSFHSPSSRGSPVTAETLFRVSYLY